MENSVLHLLVLAAVAVFLIWKLRSVLGTRGGFEKPSPSAEDMLKTDTRDQKETPQSDVDYDILDHAEAGSFTEKALLSMKQIEADFGVNTFLEGARGAYEMILMSFEQGDISQVRNFLDDDIAEGFLVAVKQREDDGLKVEANFIGLREMKLLGATFDEKTAEAEITVRYIAELTRVVRDAEGECVGGSEKDIHRQVDVWTYARVMGTDDPNWRLIATEG